MTRPDFKWYRGIGLNSLIHSAKGSTWEEHKYVKRIDGTYYYPDGYEGGRNISSLKDAKDSSGKDSSDGTTDKGNYELSAADIENLAREVIRGNFGNGQVRKDLLAGNYDAIQKRVNELMRTGVGSTKISEASEEVEETGKKAMEKIASSSTSTSKTADIQKVFSVYNKHRAKG